MRTMILGITTLALFTGCSTVDKISESSYTFKNKSSSDISIEIARQHDGIIAEQYNIIKDNELVLSYGVPGEEYVEYPLHLSRRIHIATKLIVSNGKVEVIEYSSDRTGLYDHKSYKLVSSGAVRYYEYTFTDDFFENGTPITE